MKRKLNDFALIIIMLFGYLYQLIQYKIIPIPPAHNKLFHAYFEL